MKVKRLGPIPPIVLKDPDTWSENYRRECEARAVARASFDKRNNYLDLVELRRGKRGRQMIEQDLESIWKEKK